jgi:hypothetical protein
MARTSWINNKGGIWTDAPDWSGGVVPGAGDDVVIGVAPGAGGFYDIDLSGITVMLHSLTLRQAHATLNVDGTELSTELFLDAGTMALGLGQIGAGTFAYSSLSGTIVGNGGVIEIQGGGTLTAETLKGSLRVEEGSYGDMSIAGGLTGRAGATLTVDDTTLLAVSTETFNSGTIVLGGATSTGSISFLDYQSNTSTLTLGSHLDVIFNKSSTIGDGESGTNTILNDGTIAAAPGGGSLELAEATIVNAGLMLAGQGDTIDIDAGEFTNSGTIMVTAGGILSGDVSHWVNQGAIDIAGGTLALDGPGATLAEINLATFTNGGVVSFGGTIGNAHHTLTLGTGSGLPGIELANGGAIRGGTLVSNGGLAFTGGTLNNVTFETPLDLSEAGSTLTVAGALVGAVASGSGPGTVLLTGIGAVLDLSGSGMLVNLVIDAGSGSGTVGSESETGATLEFGPSAETTYTLAAGSTLSQTGAMLTLADTPFYQYINAPLFINRGAITADVAGGSLAIDGPGIDNIGSISIGGGEECIIQGNEGFSNAGTLAVTAGGSVSIYASQFTNTGTISIAALGTLLLRSEITTASLGSVSVANGGTFELSSQIDNTGATLAFGSGGAISEAYFNGTIEGGTVKSSAGALTYAGGSFDDVTFDGVLSIGGASSQTLSISNGFTATGEDGSGRGSIVLTGGTTTLGFYQGGSLDNTAIDSAASNGTITGGSQSQILTLASSVAITQTGKAAQLGSNDVVAYSPDSDIETAASITASVAGGTFTLQGAVVNTGMIAISNGETLGLDSAYITNTGLISVTDGVLLIEYSDLAALQSVVVGDSAADVAGTLSLQGGTLDLAQSGFTLFQVGSDGLDADDAPPVGPAFATQILGGVIVDPTGLLQLARDSAFIGVTYEGTLNIDRPFAELELEQGSSVTGANGVGAGLINLTGAGTALMTDTLDNVTIDIGSAGLSYDSTTVQPATVSGEVLGATVRISQTGIYASIFSQGDFTSTLSSAANITADLAGGTFTVWGGQVTSSGTIVVGSKVDFTIGSADFTNTGLIEVGRSGATLTLDTAGYFESADVAPSSFTNAGTILLTHGALAELTGNGIFPMVPITNASGAVISGYGTVDVGIVNEGLVQASGGTLALTDAVSGAGTLQVDAGATLQLAGVGVGGIANFSGAGGVLGLSPMSFLGAIGGFAAGDTIDLASTAASSARFSGDTILVTLTAGGTLTLDTTSALSGSLTVTAGTSGDSVIAYASSTALFAPTHQS